jgi:chemotaxis protein MotB
MVKRKTEASDVQSPDSSAWLVTFSDLIMLLLTFFVLLLTMSSMDTKKLKETFAHFRGAPGVLELAGSREISNLSNFITKYQTSDSLLVIDQDHIRKMLIPLTKSVKGTQKTTIKDLYQQISIADDYRGIVLSFNENILFDPGHETIRKEAFPFLASIAETIEFCPNHILIAGHTDSIPLQSKSYESNWELSLYRSLSVLEYFLEVKKLSPERFAVSAYGAARPLHPNNTEENRALNRRVEIIFKHL